MKLEGNIPLTPEEEKKLLMGGPMKTPKSGCLSIIIIVFFLTVATIIV